MNRNSSIILGIASLAIGLLATAAFAGNYEQAVTSLSPSYYWHLDDANGALVTTPTVGNAKLLYRYRNGDNTGTVNGKVDVVPGIYGTAALMGNPGSAILDGQTAAGYGADAGSLATFFPGSATGTGLPGQHSGWTVEFWVNTPTHTASSYNAYGISNPVGNDGHPYSFNFNFASSTSSYMDLWNTQTDLVTDPRFEVLNDGITPNQWHMVALTWTRTGSTTVDYQMFTDGILKGATTVTGLNAANFGAWGTVFFGGATVAGAGGALDEVAIFDYTLSQQQILDQFYSIPEPGTLSLLALGGAVLVWRRRVAAKRA